MSTSSRRAVLLILILFGLGLGIYRLSPPVPNRGAPSPKLQVNARSPNPGERIAIVPGEPLDVTLNWDIDGASDHEILRVKRANAPFDPGLVVVDVTGRRTYAMRLKATGRYEWSIEAHGSTDGRSARVTGSFTLEREASPAPPPIAGQHIEVPPPAAREPAEAASGPREMPTAPLMPAPQTPAPPEPAAPVPAPPTVDSIPVPIDVTAPKPGATLEARDDEASPVTLRWPAREDADHYNVFVYDEAGRVRARRRTTEDSVGVPLAHEHTYRWAVFPVGKGGSDQPAPAVPDDAPSFTIGSYRKLALSVAEEPAALYAWARYMLSYARFVGDNYDLNTRTTQRLYEGAGELALGYWSRVTRLGVLAHAELAGFWLDHDFKPRNYADGGIDLGYRQILGNGSRLRFWAGPAMQESPLIVRDALTDNFDFRRVRTYGPRLQIVYSREMKDHPRYGWNAFGTFYRPLASDGTPNGRPFSPRATFTLGGSFTFRDTLRKKWMLGYSYREQNLAYGSTDRSGRLNFSTLSGHYVTFTLEYGLADPQK